MARPKAQINRREEVLNSAKKLFRENGYEKTTVDDIAKHAGISKGSVYLDFKTKEDIFFSILEEYLMGQFERFSNLIKNPKPPYLDRLKELIVEDVLTVFDLAGEGHQNCEALIYTNIDMKNKLSDYFEAWGNIMLTIIEKAKDNGEIDLNVDSKIISKLIDIGVIGFYPPYKCNIYYLKEVQSNLTNEQIREKLKHDMALYLDILFSGLKKQKEVKNEI